MRERIAEALRWLAVRVDKKIDIAVEEQQLQSLAVVLVDSGIGEKLFKAAFKDGIDGSLGKMRYEVHSSNLNGAKYFDGYIRALETAWGRMEQFATRRTNGRASR